MNRAFNCVWWEDSHRLSDSVAVDSWSGYSHPNGYMTRFNFSPSDAGTSAAHAMTGVENTAAHAAAGIESGALAALHAAAEPISPLIQMIMRMPGQIGVISSAFEALGNFFFSHANLLSHLDPALLAMHIDLSHVTSLAGGAEHLGIDLNLLPADAPIMQTMHGAGMNLGDLKGQFAHSEILKDSVAFRDQIKVSGTLDLNRTQFETGRGLSSQVDGLGKADSLSGPSLRDATGSPTNLASSQRLFSERAFTLPKNAPNMSTNSTVASTTGQAATPSNAINVSGSPLGQQVEAAPAVGQASDAAVGSGNVSANVNEMTKSSAENSANTGYGPSGAVGDHSRSLIADNSTPSFKPTLGSADSTSGYDANYLQHQTVATPEAHPLGGLKAHQMSLGGDVKPAAGADTSHLAHAKPSASHSLSKAPAQHSLSSHNATSTHHHTLSRQTDMISHRAPTRVQYDAPKASVASAGNAEVQGQPVGAAEQTATGSADGTIASGSPETAPVAPSTYTIRAGDCLWNIAKDHLHSATRWSEIYKMNTDAIGTNPSLIHPGTNINLPGGSGSELTASGLENGEYIVKSGDNLWDISKHFSGDGSKWGEIYKANTDVIGSNPDLILPGQHLHIPGAESATETVAQAPAAAGQQLAQASVDPSQAAGADSGTVASSGGGLEAAAQPHAVQSYAPGDVPATAGTEISQAPTAAVEATPAAAAPATISAAPAAAPTAAPTATPVAAGPGAAAAATLSMPQPSLAELHQIGTESSVVKSSLAPDLAQFMRRTK